MFRYPTSGKGACSSSETETFTASGCTITGDPSSPNCNWGGVYTLSGSRCTPYCGGGAYGDYTFPCQSYGGSAPYTDKTIFFNRPTKRYVADATVVDAFDITWDANKTFGGGCNATTLGIKKCTLEVGTSAILFRIYWKSNTIWKYQLNLCQEMAEYSTKINAQTNASETWSLGLEATAGSSNITYATGLIPQAEQNISTTEKVTLQHYRPNKLGLEMSMGWDVDPVFTSCDTPQGDFTWTAQSGLLQRTTSASFDIYRSMSVDFSGSWTITGLGSEVNSASVTIS